MVKELEAYPYSSYRYLLDEKHRPQCLQNAWIVQHYDQDTESIKALLSAAVDTEQLAQLKKAASLIDAPNIDTKPDIRKLQKMLRGKHAIQERNTAILKAIKQGYSQHMIAKVLGISQPAVYGVIKRSRK